MPAASLREQIESVHASAWRWALLCARGRRELAEEALQNTYLDLLEGRAVWRAEASFRTFVFAVLQRQLWRLQRQQRLQAALVSLGLREADLDAAAAPDRRAEGDALVQALASLPRRQREVLALAFGADLSLAEIAAVLGVGLGSVRTHYERGKARLRQRIHHDRGQDR